MDDRVENDTLTVTADRSVGDVLSGPVRGLTEEEREILVRRIEAFREEKESLKAHCLAAAGILPRREFMLWLADHIPAEDRDMIRAAYLGHPCDPLKKRRGTVWKSLSEIGIRIRRPTAAEKPTDEERLREWEALCDVTGAYEYIDTHAHYDMDAYDGYRDELLDLMHRRGGLAGALIPAVTLAGCVRTLRLFGENNGSCGWLRFAFAIHPKYLWREPDLSDDRFCLIKTMLSHPRCAAVGETGLDYSYNGFCPEHQRLQDKYFRLFIRLANETGRPLILHIRSAESGMAAEEDALKILEEEPVQHGAVCHCFGSGPETAEAFIRRGAGYFGIGGRVLYDTDAALRETVAAMPESSLLLETDAPYIRLPGAPRPNTSLAIVGIAEAVARIRRTDAAHIIAVSNRNACRLFGFSET